MTMVHYSALILAYLLLLLALLQGWWFLAAGIILGTSVWVSPAPLLPLAIALDGYFGAFATLPVLSLSALSWYILLATLRPALNVVQSPHA